MKVLLRFEGFRCAIIIKTKKRYRSLILNTNITGDNWFFCKHKNPSHNYAFYRVLIFGVVLKDEGAEVDRYILKQRESRRGKGINEQKNIY